MFATIGPSAMGIASIFGLFVAFGVWKSFPDVALPSLRRPKTRRSPPCIGWLKCPSWH